MKKMLALVTALLMAFACVSAALADDGVVRYGDTGSQVKHVQQILKNYHYYTGKINGTFDKDTLKAVKEFQKYNGLNADGKVGEKTLYYMESGIAVYAPVKDDTANKADVKHVQTRLKYYGYYSGKIDGIFGAQSVSALRAFQSANGLKVDGAAGADTMAKLNSETAVKKSDIGTQYTKIKIGSTGAFVKNVQKLLWGLGYYNGDWNGVFDNAMWKAVKAFQSDNGLKADGIVGPNTWAVMNGDPIGKKEAEQQVSEVIQNHQQRLQELGWYNGSLTGKYDAATVAAVKAFQSASGLKVDGAVGSQTAGKLYAMDAITKAEANQNQKIDSHPVIRPGVQGSYVREIQTLLKQKGYYAGNVDGKFGKGTTEAVKSFQVANGLKDDGKVGKETWAILLK